MIVQRTVAEFLASQITGLAVFKDELAASVSPSFPYMMTSLVGNKRNSLGAGHRDLLTDLDQTKVYFNEQSLRFTFRAVSTDSENGNELVSRLVRETDELLRSLTRTGGVTLTDSVTLLPVHIAYIEFNNETDIQTITDQLPVVYQKSITFMLRIVDPSVVQLESPPIQQIQLSM